MLKICFLNTQACSQRDALVSFLKSEHCTDVDIFAFTEVINASGVEPGDVHQAGDWTQQLAGRQILEGAVLAAHHPHRWRNIYSANNVWTPFQSEPAGKEINDAKFGNFLCLNSLLTIVDYGDRIVIRENENEYRCQKLQYAVISHDTGTYLIVSYHGMWIRRNTKGDAPEQYEQSENLLRIVRELINEYAVDKVIFGGDLNLGLNTEALRTIETSEPVPGRGTFRNLIREFKIENTRTELYRHHGLPGYEHADYVFVSLQVTVDDFQVPDMPISDHRPLILTIS